MIETKLCHRCEETKTVAEFHRDRSKADGFHTLCKSCKEVAQKKWRLANDRSTYQKQYRADNREVLLEGKKQWYNDNKERQLANMSAWVKNNRAAFRVIQSRYRRNNLGKFANRENKRRAGKLSAMPKWLNQAELVEIEYLYMYNQIMPGTWEVDHIVPLQGKTICGLHTPENLQVISAKENRMKSNKFREVA
jgi:hypothetical protein